MRRGAPAIGVACVFFWLAACGAPQADQPQPEASFVVSGATVVDGTGAPGYAASVRVRGGNVEAVGDLTPAGDEVVVDGSGLVLAPGFIDTHSHHDRGLFEELDALAAVSQGITTIVIGQDGGSPLPLSHFFERLEVTPAAVNVAAYIGHNSVRRSIMGDDFQRVATSAEIEAMAELVRAGMTDGALGISTGLEYDPGIYSTTEEVLDLARAVAARGGRYISHMRSEDRALWDAVEEAVLIARETSIPVQISHMKLAMKGLWGQAPQLIERLEQARSEGLEITADVYPYEYWQSTMTVLFPERDFTDREAATFALEELAPPDGMIIGDFGPDSTLEGMTLSEIAEARSTDVVTTFMDLIAESQAYARETGRGGESIVARSMTFDDIAELLAWEHTNVSSDGGLRGAHPRGFGTYPRVLGRYVREAGRLGLEEAVHKMTALAADHMGLSGLGTIAAGQAADLVLFDPQTVLDRSTPQEPHLTSVGIERVWVAGEVVYEGATGVTPARPGRVLRRPTR